MDEIDEHFALLNTNIQQCVSSTKHGNQTTSELVDIADVQTTATQDVATKIRRRNELYAHHVQHQCRHASYQYYESEFGLCWWSIISRMNGSWINATSFYVSI